MNEILINNSVILSFLISLIVFCKFTERRGGKQVKYVFERGQTDFDNQLFMAFYVDIILCYRLFLLKT